jgi:transketolase
MTGRDMEQMARRMRRKIIDMAFRSGGPHVGSALSCTDIIATLYGDILRLDPWEKRDIFVLSKAHAAMALYAALAERGIIERRLLDNYHRDNGSLPAHLDRFTAPGIECSAGSLGHGFNMALGMAFGFKRQQAHRRVFVLIGDGETQEGSIWEGALFAPRLGLDNVTAIMDYNNLQGYGRPRDICGFEPIATKWEAFGWQVQTIDGHDCQALRQALAAPTTGRPRMIIAATVKGKGVSFMEDQLIWHYYVVTAEHRAKAMEELA